MASPCTCLQSVNTQRTIPYHSVIHASRAQTENSTTCRGQRPFFRAHSVGTMPAHGVTLLAASVMQASMTWIAATKPNAMHALRTHINRCEARTPMQMSSRKVSLAASAYPQMSKFVTAVQTIQPRLQPASTSRTAHAMPVST